MILESLYQSWTLSKAFWIYIFFDKGICTLKKFSLPPHFFLQAILKKLRITD